MATSIASFRTKYEHTLDVPVFAGLMQDGDGLGTKMQYAADCDGIDFADHCLRPAAMPLAHGYPLAAPIESLAVLYRRYINGGDTVLVAGSGGAIWTRILPYGSWVRQASGFQSNLWDTVCYEINTSADAPEDVLLLTNAEDGMWCLHGNDLSITFVNTPKKFGVICLHKERVWGAAIDGEPDMLVYSAPYDPFDWAANEEVPEDGAGDVLQPSWDGDAFVALRTFGDYLLAIKRGGIWRVSNASPVEYIFTQCYGGGTLAENTVCVDRDRVLMLGRGGMMKFDGTVVTNYDPDRARGFFATMNQARITRACACLYRDVCYVALPLLNGQENGALLLIDRIHGTWSLRRDVHIRTMAASGQDGLYYTSVENPYDVYTYGAGDGVAAVRYVSAWQDLSVKHVAKSGFIVRMTVQADAPVTLRVTLETEKKAKTKTVTFDGTRMKNVQFSHGGKRFRLKIESDAGTAPWVLLGGLQIEMELDPE